MANYSEATYKVMITNIGLDLIEQAMSGGNSLELKYMAFKKADSPDWIPTGLENKSLDQYELVKELVSAQAVEGTVRYTSIITSADESGTFTELALFLADGTLFACANIPQLEHVKEKGAITESKVTAVLTAENAQNVVVNIPSSVYITEEYANSFYLRTDGTNFPSQNLNLNGTKIEMVGEGKNPHDVATINQILPVGSIFLWAGLTIPSNTVKCNGAYYPKSGSYTELWNVVGNMYTPKDKQKAGEFMVPNIKAPEDSVNNYLTYVIKYKF